MKVYMDIIANHTADVIQYRDVPPSDCVSQPRRLSLSAAQRRRRRLTAINDGFLGDDIQTPTISQADRPAYAYTPFVPAARKRQVKTPAWLNDPIYYHNRGNSTFAGESSTMGDFVGLDDLMTENPRVVQGMIDIFGQWIDASAIDGFRIDTARHVNPEFWAAFVPAMLARAKAKGIPNFHIFGEVADSMEPAALAAHPRRRLPAVLDFAFRAAIRPGREAGEVGTDRLERWSLPAIRSTKAAKRPRASSPTFIGNHDRAASPSSCAQGQSRRRARRNCWRAPARPRDAAPAARRADHLFGRRAGLHRRRRRPGRARGHVRQQGRRL
jgi:hypothetical protein